MFGTVLRLLCVLAPARVPLWMQDLMRPRLLCLPQIFVALLKTIQPDVPKALVNEALDILVPVLPLRMRHLEEQRFPSWIRYAKKMLSEEQHSMPHMLHIWQLVVRHADLFYASRAQFVPQMVNNLSRIGLPQNTVVESRRLSMDLVALIMRWEKQRIANSKAGVSSVDLMSRKRAREPTPPTASALAEPAKEEAPKAEPGEGNAAKPADDAAATGTAPEKPDAAPAEAQPPADPAAEKEKQSDEPPAKLQRIDSALATGDLAAQPSEDLGKALSVPGASPAATPATTPAQRTPSNVPEEEFKVSSSMEEMIVSFLVRITFLLCESRDKDMQGMVGHGQVRRGASHPHCMGPAGRARGFRCTLISTSTAYVGCGVLVGIAPVANV